MQEWSGIGPRVLKALEGADPPDVIEVGDTQIARYAESGKLRGLGRENRLPGLAEPGKANGARYGIPWYALGDGPKDADEQSPSETDVFAQGEITRIVSVPGRAALIEAGHRMTGPRRPYGPGDPGIQPSHIPALHSGHVESSRSRKK